MKHETEIFAQFFYLLVDGVLLTPVLEFSWGIFEPGDETL